MAPFVFIAGLLLGVGWVLDVPRRLFGAALYTEQFLSVCLGFTLALAFISVQDRRPRWYVAVLALMASLLAFVYASLSLRRLFQGEYIGEWRGFSQVETYSYSALWLALGVALLVGGLVLRSQVLRLASGALIVIAVAKVFLFDMSELEGVLRALSFIGLGIVLIGIGLFYQRMLRLGLGGPRPEPVVEPPMSANPG